MESKFSGEHGGDLNISPPPVLGLAHSDLFSLTDPWTWATVNKTQHGDALEVTEGWKYILQVNRNEGIQEARPKGGCYNLFCSHRLYVSPSIFDTRFCFVFPFKVLFVI